MGVVSEKLHSSKSRASEEPAFPKQMNKESVEQHIKQLESRFLDLVYCTRIALVDNGINVDELHGWLVALDVSRKHEHQEFIDNHLMNIHQDTTFSNLWAKLGKYWDFLNFDLLEHVITKFGSEDLKQKMKSYKHDLHSFRKSTRLCDFIHCWPVRGQTPPRDRTQRVHYEGRSSVGQLYPRRP